MADLFTFLDPKDAIDYNLVGYDNELAATRTLCTRVVKEKKAESILVFGMSGGGKSSFPKKLQYEINSKSGLEVAVITLTCNACGTRASQELEYITDQLIDVRNLLHTWKDSGVILCLDELDTIAPDRLKQIGDKRFTSLSLKLMGFLTSNWDNCHSLVTLMNTNDPYGMESALIDRAGGIVYLPPLDKRSAITILSQFKIADEDAVYNALELLLEGNIFTARGLSKACEKTLALLKSGMTPSAEVANVIFGYLPPSIRKEDVDLYETRYQQLIKQARQFVSNEIKRGGIP